MPRKRHSAHPKAGKTRALDISPETCALLAAHKRHQAEVKLANRIAYHDRGLVFAKEGRTRTTDRLGDPLQANNIAQREYAELVKIPLSAMRELMEREPGVEQKLWIQATTMIRETGYSRREISNSSPSGSLA